MMNVDLLSPRLVQQQMDFKQEAKVSFERKEEDFEISFQSQELGRQLIHGYARLLASGYLAIERLSGFFVAWI
jgi:hypothetical protein